MPVEFTELLNYRAAQRIAKDALASLGDYIRPGMSEREIATHCDSLLRKNGADSFWYYGLGSMVYVGERTTVSESGRSYAPTPAVVRESDLVTVDTSPQRDGCWGDCARSFVVGSGPETAEFQDGVKFVEALHLYFISIATPNSTFGDIFEQVNRHIKQAGWENLDFRGNLGHTIEKESSARIFMEFENELRLRDATFFTFEPLVRKVGRKYGYRKEDIYFFDGNVLDRV